jgi:hypothetical protein
VAHPLLQCADIDPVLEMPSRVCVAKFVKEPSPAVGSIGGTINLHPFAVFQLVSHHAVTAIEFRAKRYRLEFLQHGTIGLPRFAHEHRIGACICRTKLPQ